MLIYHPFSSFRFIYVKYNLWCITKLYDYSVLANDCLGLVILFYTLFSFLLPLSNVFFPSLTGLWLFYAIPSTNYSICQLERKAKIMALASGNYCHKDCITAAILQQVGIIFEEEFWYYLHEPSYVGAFKISWIHYEKKFTKKIRPADI